MTSWYADVSFMGYLGRLNLQTSVRWHLWRIQRLVSIHLGGSILGNSKLKSPQFSLGGGDSWQLKAPVTTDQIFISGYMGWGWGYGEWEVGYSWPAKNRVLLAKWAKNSGSLTCSCIADSLSHTMCLEINQTIVVSFVVLWATEHEDKF